MIVRHLFRHAELVSASIVQQAMDVQAESWTLKQVQGDGWFVAVEVTETASLKAMNEVWF